MCRIQDRTLMLLERVHRILDKSPELLLGLGPELDLLNS